MKPQITWKDITEANLKENRPDIYFKLKAIAEANKAPAKDGKELLKRLQERL